jgi:outer membrane biosynthesis protein TonB
MLKKSLMKKITLLLYILSIHIRVMNKTISVIATIALSFALFFAYTNSATVFAQNQSTSTSAAAAAAGNDTASQNQTSATVTGSAQSLALNKTTIPAQQTSVEVNQTTKPAEGQAQIQPLENQTIQQQLPNLASLQNETMVQSTGPATTTIVNQTTIPYNQTIIGTENSTTPQQALQQSNQTGQSAQQQSNQTGQSAQQQSNQSKGPLEQIGESVGKMIGGK